MLRSLALLIFIAGTVSGCVTPAKETRFSAVYKVPGVPKAKIFDTTKIWIAENFRSAKAVIEYENAASATLIGNGSMSYPCSGLTCIGKGDWKVNYTMRFEAKDERFRLTFSNLGLSWPSSGGFAGPRRAAHSGPINTQEEIDNVKPRLLAHGESIQKTMSRETTKKNW